MRLNIVTNFQIISQVKKSRHFIVNLGMVPTVEKNGSRSYNNSDTFSFHYNKMYNTTIYGQGNVGDIRFYTDHYITDKVLAIYYGDNFEEFIFNLDNSMIESKGVDFYLGHIIKEVDIKYEERVKNDELKKLESKPKGISDNILLNPGSVSYDDLKAYLDNERKNRQL